MVRPRCARLLLAIKALKNGRGVTLITIVLADDHHLIRQGVRALLETEADFSVVGEASDGLQAAELVERLKPNILVVDFIMPGLNGMEVARRVKQCSTKTGVLLLSMYTNESYVLEAFRNGATGYVLKDSTAEDLVRAVRQVAAGQHYLSAPLSERAIESYVQNARGGKSDLYETLTAREREVLQLAAEGRSSREIAARLFISPRTAETHRANLMHKLGLHGQTDLIRYALKRGILPMEDSE
jgi:two-component system, NarL family, response regulator NreC